VPERPDFPPYVTAMLDRLTSALSGRDDLTGIYVYGSLVTGGFSAAASDVDVVVLLDREPDQTEVASLEQMHRSLLSADPRRQLHCLYAAAAHAADPERLCTYWFGDRMTQWQMKVLTQAEIAAAGVVLYGPWPPPGIEPVPMIAIQAAVRDEIGEYYRPAAASRLAWLSDSMVDHQLVALPRAEAVLTSGRLIGKTEAIGLLASFGTPGWLVREIAGRRAGQQELVSWPRRLRRAVTARRIMRAGVRRLRRLASSASG
jgi:predicted nucleotidyltransferase